MIIKINFKIEINRSEKKGSLTLALFVQSVKESISMWRAFTLCMHDFFLFVPGLLHWFDYQRQHQLLPNVQAHVPASAGDDGDQSCSASRPGGFSSPVLRALPKRFPAHVSDSQNIQLHSARATTMNSTEPSLSCPRAKPCWNRHWHSNC